MFESNHIRRAVCDMHSYKNGYFFVWIPEVPFMKPLILGAFGALESPENMCLLQQYFKVNLPNPEFGTPSFPLQ